MLSRRDDRYKMVDTIGIVSSNKLSGRHVVWEKEGFQEWILIKDEVFHRARLMIGKRRLLQTIISCIKV